MIWPDGREYKGDYEYDERHGYGTYKFKNGSIYKGNWSHNK